MKALNVVAVFVIGCIVVEAKSKLVNVNSAADCPQGQKYGPGPPASCPTLTDPNNKPAHPAEKWFTKEVFDDLFPKANIGWGPNSCSPYNYESFRLAMRYFPRFAAESGLNNGYTDRENQRRDLAAFFAHAVQETGENDANLYRVMPTKEAADACFYRGGFFNWFEGGPTSPFLDKTNPGHNPKDGEKCIPNGRYCSEAPDISYFWPCGKNMTGEFYKSCYFGRGAIQISYNYNYGQFDMWLKSQNINVDLLTNPNLVMTNIDPPLAILASLWFYMTPQPPKPAMHDIVMGDWHAGEKNEAAGYFGAIFGPTSLVINNECNGEDDTDPGGPGESRRIKAFKWFCKYFKVPVGDEKTLSCGDMPQKLGQIRHSVSWQPAWSSTWKEQPCDCAPAEYGGMIPYFQSGFYPLRFVEENEANRKWCVRTLYDSPQIYHIEDQACLKYPPGGAGQNTGPTTRKSTTTTTEAPGWTGSGGQFHCPSAGFFRDPDACNQFYQCYEGTAFKLTCPPGLFFNADLKVCDWPSNVDCAEEDIAA